MFALFILWHGTRWSKGTVTVSVATCKWRHRVRSRNSVKHSDARNWVLTIDKMQLWDLIDVCLLLFDVLATIFQLYIVGDMMYEIRKRKLEPSLLQTRVIFNLSNHIGMVWLWWRCKLYAQGGKWTAAQLNVMAVARIRTPVTRVTNSVLKKE